MPFVKAFLVMFVVQFSRYLLIAGAGYLFFWKWKNPFTEKNRIQKIDFRSKDLWREFGYSVQTCLIFGVIFGFAFQGVYITEGLKFNVPYDLLCLIGLILFHDTYFYWMHRALHHPKIFKYVHRVHHISQNPSPWASLSFQPSEAILEGIWVIPVHMIAPIQPSVWAIFGIFIIGINVLGHLGVETYPRWWSTHPVMKWVNFSTYHNEHHHYFVGNYGLYLSFWDRMMGTLRPANDLETDHGQLATHLVRSTTPSSFT